MNVKDKALELIEEYNSYGDHRKVKPLNGFGESFLQDTAVYFAVYKLDSGESKPVGFKQRGELFYSYGDGHVPLNVDEAINNLEKQLSEIPPK